MTVFHDYAATLTQPTLAVAGGAGVAGARYDEVIAADGSFRAAWKGLAALAMTVTPAELRRVEGEISTLLADDGVTASRSGARSRPWRLDPVPLVVDASSWARLEVGLAQRAELLSAVLADLYGPQRLLSEGIVPAAIVFGHAGFVRNLAGRRGSTPPLLLAAADLGRDANGEWRVIRDRVQAPAGLGYVAENRRVVSRVLPELYAEAAPHGVEPYLSALRSALLAGDDDAVDPRVVLLSPGTYSRSAYDQAFLASALGFPLVQGSDLVVRDGAVWMKPPGWPSVAAPERVDVILRRVDAAWCDPLELRADSQLGVAGLAQSVRRDRVRVSNDLGTGVLENPALAPFLSAACEALLGEQLRLPSVPSWWCGDDDAEQVLDRLAREPGAFVVRTIDGPGPRRGAPSPRRLRERILAAPHRFVVQERLPLSQSPVWGSDGRSSGAAGARPLVLRTFTLRHGSVYRPLAGGLATVLDEEQRPLAAKDVWVLKAAATDPDQGLPTEAPAARVPAVTVLAPRALEDMFWSGRYAERAEDLLRLVLTTVSPAQDVRARPASPHGISVAVLQGVIEQLAGLRYANLDDELRSLLLDADRPGSVAQSLDGLRDALEGVRDQLSGDTWRLFGQTERAAQVLRESPRSQQTAESASRMLTAVLFLHGVTASMIRDAGWHMIEAGRYLERSLQVCTLLAATTTVRRGIDVDREVSNSVVMAAESSITHRRRYRGHVRTTGVLELLLMDPDNPRSLAFSLAQLRTHLVAMPASTGSTRPERLLEHLQQMLDEAEVSALGAIGGAGRPRLERFLTDATAQLASLADAIAGLHFAGGPTPRQISSMSLTEMMGARS